VAQVRQQDRVLKWVAREARTANQRVILKRRVCKWLKRNGYDDDEEDEDDEEDDDDDEEDDGDDVDYDDEDSEVYYRDGKLKEPKLWNRLQMEQVRALLFMTHIVDHRDEQCYDINGT
jgi:ABC-type Zn2+ transport system substrate-binding protein/surface adhesin